MSEEKKTTEDELTELEQLEAEIEALVNEEPASEEDTNSAAKDEVEAEEEAGEGKEEESAEKEPEEEADPEAKEETPADEHKEEEQPANNAAFARMRHEKKQAEQKLADLQKKLDPQSETADSAVGKLVKVWDSGEGDEGTLMASIRQAGSQELSAIYEKAVSGEFGAHGDDVVAMVQREMPMIQNREAATKAQAQTRQDALMKDYNAEADMAKSEYPDYVDAQSDASKAKTGFDKKMLGTLDPETGELDGAGLLPDDLANYIQSHPLVHHQLADSVFKASLANSDSSAAKVAALTKERDNFKTRLAKYETIGAPTGGKSTDTPTGNETAEDIEKEIERQFGN